MHEQKERIKYIRALERYLNSIVSYLSKTEELSKEHFINKIQNSNALLKKVKQTPLYKEWYKNLESLINKIQSYEDSDNSIEEIKEDILYSANQLDKSRNIKKYKKPKHKNLYDGW